MTEDRPLYAISEKAAKKVLPYSVPLWLMGRARITTSHRMSRTSNIVLVAGAVVSDRRATLVLFRLGQGAIADHKLFAEDFGGRSMAEAFSGCAVKLVADGVDRPCGQAFGVDLTREPASDTAVGVFDRALLPGRLRIAKHGVIAPRPRVLFLICDDLAAVR